jgi:hypothetical protein
VSPYWLIPGHQPASDDKQGDRSTQEISEQIITAATTIVAACSSARRRDVSRSLFRFDFAIRISALGCSQPSCRNVVRVSPDGLVFCQSLFFVPLAACQPVRTGYGRSNSKIRALTLH